MNDKPTGWAADVPEPWEAVATLTDVTRVSRTPDGPLTEPTAFTGKTVVAEFEYLTGEALADGGKPRIRMYLGWEGRDHYHQLELAGDGLLYLAELLARIYGVTLLPGNPDDGEEQ